MKTRNFFGLTICIAILLALLTYWREYSLREQVPLYQVLLWQIAIWTPWTIGFMLFKRAIIKTGRTTFRIPLLIGSSVVWIGLHFGWFFFISSNYSPYIGQYGCRFGVFRYFFVFWTLIDIGLIWFVIDKLKSAKKEELPPPLLFELTRGNNKYFCEPSQIHYLTAENYYTRVYTTEGAFVMRKPLKSFYDLLPQDIFKKIHRSTIVNVNYVTELARGNGHTLEVIMKDGTRRKVSRSFVKEVTLFFKDRTY